jgi:signal transduction histidine kinase
MAIVVAVFVAATAYTQFLLTSDVDALDIASNAAPSVAYLADARAELRLLARDAASGARRSYAEHRRALDAALVEYAKTPDYPGEHDLYVTVRDDLALLDTRMAAHASIDKELDDVDASMHALSELNRSHLVHSEQAIARAGRRRNRLAFVLDGIGIAIACFATILAIRTVERYIATLRRRARELEHLAIQVGHDIANPLAPIQVVMHEDDATQDPMRQKALERGRRALQRIQATIERLSLFARAGVAPPPPLPSTPLEPALRAAARAAGLEVTVDPAWQVRCAEPVLRDLLADLVSATVPSTGDIDVSVSPRSVRVAVRCTPDGDGAGDPFDPRLHTPGAEHPGIDLRLATVRRYVEAHGGTVGWRRPRGEREELWIELPRA